MTSSSFLPYGRHLIEEDDIKAVANVLQSDFLTTGPAVESFEQAFADFVEVPHALACASGTAALHLAALALGLGEGDLVVVPSVTFLATANAARYVGAEVVFADVEAESGLTNATLVAEALERARKHGDKVRAVFSVHLNGQPADPAGIGALASERGLYVVEDACHALGTTYPSGDVTCQVGACAHADIATFSFHPVKIIAMGEGGAVTTRDPTLADRVRRLRNHGMVRSPDAFECHKQAFDSGEPNPWYYEMPEPGYNYRLSDISCALGLSQLKKLPRFAARRRELTARYDALLKALAPTVRPISRSAGCNPAWHLYVVLIDFEAAGLSRGEVMRELSKRGIGTQVHYLPVHRQPYYERRYGEQELAGADAYYAHSLTLPLFPGMSDEDVDRTVSTLTEILGGP